MLQFFMWLFFFGVRNNRPPRGVTCLCELECFYACFCSLYFNMIAVCEQDLHLFACRLLHFIYGCNDLLFGIRLTQHMVVLVRHNTGTDVEGVLHAIDGNFCI